MHKIPACLLSSPFYGTADSSPYARDMSLVFVSVHVLACRTKHYFQYKRVSGLSPFYYPKMHTLSKIDPFPTSGEKVGSHLPDFLQ